MLSATGSHRFRSFDPIKHLASGLFGRFVILLKLARNVTMSTVHSKRL